MYLIPMNRRIVWQWFHVCTLKYADVLLHNRKTRDCILQKYFHFDASSCITHSVLEIFISCIYISRGVYVESDGFYFSFIAQSMRKLLL